jgi:hypothetical protein
MKVTKGALSANCIFIFYLPSLLKTNFPIWISLIARPIQLRSVSIGAWKWAGEIVPSCPFDLFSSFRQIGELRIKRWTNHFVSFYFYFLLNCMCWFGWTNGRAGPCKRGNSMADPTVSCSGRNGTLREARRWEVPSATTPTERSSSGSNVNR